MSLHSTLYVITFISFSSFSAGRIDHGHHAGSAIRALTDAVALNKAVAKAIDIVKKGNIAFNYSIVLIGLENTTSFRSKFGQVIFVRLLSKSLPCICQLLSRAQTYPFFILYVYQSTGSGKENVPVSAYSLPMLVSVYKKM